MTLRRMNEGAMGSTGYVDTADLRPQIDANDEDASTNVRFTRPAIMDALHNG